MDGDFADNAFEASRVIDGTCDEFYTVTGIFEDDRTISGTLDIRFSGSFCLNCRAQSYTFRGTRQ